MALAQHLTVTGAGTTAVNGTYTLSTVNDTSSGYYYTGHLYYKNDATSTTINRASDGTWYFHVFTPADQATYASDLTGPTDTPTSANGAGWTAGGGSTGYYGVAPVPQVNVTVPAATPSAPNWFYLSDTANPAGIFSKPLPTDSRWAYDSPFILHDNSVGDTTTYYSVSGHDLYAMIDFGTAVLVSAVETEIGYSGGVASYSESNGPYYWDGSAWQFVSGSGSHGTFTAVSPAKSTRYLIFGMRSSGISDFRANITAPPPAPINLTATLVP